MKERHPKGHFIGLGVAMGIPLGIPLGLALGNIALGPALGAGLGLVIGLVLERNKNPQPRELTPEERKTVRRNQMTVLIIGLILFVAVLAMYFAR